MQIIEYKLDGDGTVPNFVKDGGYFIFDHKIIGVSIDTTERFMPESVTVLTNQELINRVISLNLRNEENTELSTEEKTTIATAWLTNKGFIA